MKNRSEQQEQRIIRAIGLLSEDVASLKQTLDESNKKVEEDSY